jgi:hypothetical protein
MMSAVTDSRSPVRRSGRPPRYLVRCEAGRWRLFFRELRAGCFAGRDEAVRAAEHLAAEAAQLGRQSYLVIESPDQGVEIRRLRRGPDGGGRRVVAKVRWLPPRRR